jgi:hypothetical protein
MVAAVEKAWTHPRMMGAVASMPMNWLRVEKKGRTRTVEPYHCDQSSGGIGLRPRPEIEPKTALMATEFGLIHEIQLKYEMPAGWRESD